MFIAAAIVSSVLALALIASARGKLVKDPRQMKIMATVGFPEDKLWLLAAAEIAGAVGLVVGLFWWPIGIAAAIGVVLYFVGAVSAHLRVKDNFVSALAVLLVAVAALVLRSATT
jgi:uncharacterized membrane protein YphA (DoxX/SURF4 family)